MKLKAQIKRLLTSHCLQIPDIKTYDSARGGPINAPGPNAFTRVTVITTGNMAGR